MILIKKQFFEKIMYWSLKWEILIDANSEPIRFALWCCDSICHEVFTFIPIGSGHTVSMV